MKILNANFVTLVDFILYSVYYEIKQQMVNMCIHVEYVCVCVYMRAYV